MQSCAVVCSLHEHVCPSRKLACYLISMTYTIFFCLLVNWLVFAADIENDACVFPIVNA